MGSDANQLVITGSRKWSDAARIAKYLDIEHRNRPIACLYSGGAEGADRLCEAWARQNQVPLHIEALTAEDWARYGPGAGSIRNGALLKAAQERGGPVRVIGFWLEDIKQSPGTFDMLKKALTRHVPAFVVPAEEKPYRFTRDHAHWFAGGSQGPRPEEMNLFAGM